MAIFFSTKRKVDRLLAVMQEVTIFEGLSIFQNFYEVYCHNNIGADDREPYIQRHSFMEAPR